MDQSYRGKKSFHILDCETLEEVSYKERDVFPDKNYEPPLFRWSEKESYVALIQVGKNRRYNRQERRIVIYDFSKRNFLDLKLPKTIYAFGWYDDQTFAYVTEKLEVFICNATDGLHQKSELKIVPYSFK